MIIQGPSHWIEIYFGRPEGGSSLEFDMDRSNLEVFGYAISRDPDPITSVFVRLYPDDDEPSSWPLIRLGASPIPLSELEDPADRWGKYFPPEENSNKWQWFMRFEIVGGDIEYLDDQYSLEVSAGDVYRTFNESIEFWMAIDEGHVLPYLDLTSPVNGSVWSGPSVDISGIANSDIGITRIELSFDNDSWTSITGLENWTYTMSTDVLGEGNHSVRVRAFDGEAYSPEVERWFLVELDDDGGNGPDDGGLSITDTALLAIAILLLAIGVFGLVALRLRKNRPPT